MKKIIYLFIAVAIMYSCKKNDEALSVRKLIFKEDADSVVVALKNYDFFTASTTISFFNEDFLNNNSGWPIINPTGGVSPNLNDVKVVNGEYKIFCDVNPLVLSISKAIDTSKNFEVECKVRNEDRIGSTSSFPSQGFFFCSNVTGTTITGTGINLTGGVTLKYFIIKNYYIGGNNTKQLTYPMETDYDILTFRKVKNKCSYFLNKKFIEIAPKSNFTFVGNRIGFTAQNTMKIDYIKINYLTL